MSQSRSRINLQIRTAILLFATLVITSKICFQSFNQIYANLKAGYGFTDEGGPLIALYERAIHGTSSYTFTFVEPLNFIFAISNQDIYTFRVFGLLILLSILLYFFSKNITKSKSKNILLLFLTLILLLSLMTIPSVFRYLLVTPTYQWTILVSSVLINIIHFGKHATKRWSKYATIIAITILIFGMGLSRPTSGVVGLATVLIYLLTLSIKNFRSAMLILVLQLIICLSVFASNFYNLQDRLLESIEISKSFDPNGYNISAEIKDVLMPVFPLLIISALVYFCSRYLLNEQKKDLTKRKIVVSTNSLPIISVTLITIIYLYPRIQISSPNLGYLLSMIVLNSILGAYLIGIREFSALWILTSLPYTSQFGSNTPAIGNVQILFLSQSLLTLGIFLQAFYTNNEKEYSFKLQSVPQTLEFLSIFTLLVSLSAYSHFTDTQVGNNFEKTLYPIASSKSSSNGLYYTTEKLRSLENFSINAKLKRGEEVIDLSSYHPGIILYAGGIQSQRALPDKHWIYNIKKQIEFVLDLHGKQLSEEGTKILLETNLKATLKGCYSLSSLIAVPEISTELKTQNFDVKVRTIALYISSPEDLTLYPNNAMLVETCVG